MNVEYLREMRQNYLMIQMEENQGEGFEARMMIGNSIEGLMKFRIKKSDNQCKFCYEITSKQPLSRILEKQAINAVQIRRLLLGIARTLTTMEDYLLTEEQILLDPDYIYVDPEEFQPFLCLLPGKKGDFPEEFSSFLQFLLGKVDHEDKEAVILVYGMYRESLKENYGLDNLLRWLMKEKYPDMEYRNKEGECEKIKTENTETWETEPRFQEDARFEEHQKIGSYQAEQKEKTVIPQRKSAYIYFLPGIVMILLAVGIRFFSGRYEIVKYGSCLEAAGLLLLIAGGILCCCKLFFSKKKYQAKDSVPISHDPPSYSQLLYERTLKPTVSSDQRIHNQTSYRETSTETSELNPIISDQNSKLKVSAQPGQWQMIFEEPEEDLEEVSMPQETQGEEMHTMLLWNKDEKKTVRSLVSQDGEKDILLSYYPFIIGKQEGLCDYVLDKSTVSRLHVRFDETENGYQVTDLNSTNGTFVNGRPLDANGTASVQPGDEIGVADLKFQLK